MQAGKAGCFQPSHASFPQNQVRPMRLCLVHNPPASIGYRGFVFAVGPITTLGLVGDSGRTVRSLSAASKPRITQRTARNTPSIQEEGEEHIFPSWSGVASFLVWGLSLHSCGLPFCPPWWELALPFLVGVGLVLPSWW